MNPLDFFAKGSEEPLPKHEKDALLKSVQGKDYALFGLVLETGMDYKELPLIHWNDVFQSELAIKLYDKRLKRVRTVYAPKRLFDVLMRFRGQNEELIFPYSEYMLQQKLKAATKHALGKEHSWHSLRLTYITDAASCGIPLEIAAENSGISPAMLFKYWKHTPEEVRKLMARRIL